MSNESKYLQEINQLKEEAIEDLKSILDFSKDMVSSANFRHFIKAKTVIRYNTFSAMYQRADAILALVKADQGNAASILVRSMWETLVEYDFINLSTSNLNLKIRLASESNQQLSNWTDVQRLRATYPNAETWKKTISDEAITRTILLRRNELKKFHESHPDINLKSYKTLLARLKVIDDHNLNKDPNLSTLLQFDYRSVYSLLSSDVHSTVTGNIKNSRIDPKVSLEIRLDAPKYESVRAAHVCFKYFLKFLQDLNRKQKLKKGSELLELRKSDTKHDKTYKLLQDKYGF